jgi:cellulose synthase/poly-beta-1,6-N-acetylglucosamine synthase-like glycosyltransferase
VACLQARLAIDNSRDCWLTRYFALEYAQLFDAMLPGMARLGLPIPLGGTSNHFRRDALVEVGGWDAWNVTEDADLGMRLARAGLTVDVLSSTTWEEAPIRFGAWFRQRTRWLKGWIQTSLVHGALTPRLVSEIGLFGALAVFTLTYGLVGTALGLPFFLINVVRSLVDGSLFGPDDMLQFASSVNAFLIFLLGTAALLWPLSVGAARRGLRLRLEDTALLPLYYLMASAACWWALWELFDAPSFWAKTEHGLGHRRAAPGRPDLKKASGGPSPNRRAGARG